jgi:hypothetical protein
MQFDEVSCKRSIGTRKARSAQVLLNLFAALDNDTAIPSSNCQ